MAVAGALPLALTGCASGPPAPPAPAPSASAAPTTSPGPAPVVVLDPGHDGGNAGHAREISRPVPDGRGGTKACNTTGTETDAGYPEHAFTFDVAQRAAQRLEAAGVRVILTRLDDTGVGPCVDERGRAGERAGATAVVSIHADGARPDGHGFHVALAGPPLNTAQGAPAYALATALRDGLHAAGFPPSDYTGRDGIVERPDLAGSISRRARRRWWNARTCAMRPRRGSSPPPTGGSATPTRSPPACWRSSGGESHLGGAGLGLLLLGEPIGHLLGLALDQPAHDQARDDRRCEPDVGEPAQPGLGDDAE